MQEADWLARLDPLRIPRHVAIIMDGNGRWAAARGRSRVEGHRSAVQSVREAVEAAAEVGVKYLTLYAFSSENWQRPAAEVQALMTLLSYVLDSEEERLIRNEVRLGIIGDWQGLPAPLPERLSQAMVRTALGKRLRLTLALNYGGQQELVRAMRALAEAIKQGSLDPARLSESDIKAHLWTWDLPEPELLIRTSGEQRISNFLLWDIAYTEFYFTPILWPDFRRMHFYEAIWAYQQRERRFGQVSASS